MVSCLNRRRRTSPAKRMVAFFGRSPRPGMGTQQYFSPSPRQFKNRLEVDGNAPVRPRKPQFPPVLAKSDGQKRPDSRDFEIFYEERPANYSEQHQRLSYSGRVLSEARALRRLFSFSHSRDGTHARAGCAAIAPGYRRLSSTTRAPIFVANVTIARPPSAPVPHPAGAAASPILKVLNPRPKMLREGKVSTFEPSKNSVCSHGGTPGSDRRCSPLPLCAPSGRARGATTSPQVFISSASVISRPPF